jgi:Ig-like domain from next to BRCA1 gene
MSARAIIVCSVSRLDYTVVQSGQGALLMNALGTYIRQRARQKGMSVSDVCKSASRSRQTFYALSETRERLPDLETLLDFAVALDVHPMHLVQLVFEEHQGVFCRRRGRDEPRDVSQFVRDVTVPDGAVVMAGTRFVKTWEVQNAGKTVWDNRSLQCMDEDLVVVSAHHGAELSLSPRLVPDVHRVPVPRTMPGATVQISASFRAPDLPGTCVSYWKSVDVSGALCFPDAVGLSVQVRVVAMEHTAMRRISPRKNSADAGVD